MLHCDSVFRTFFAQGLPIIPGSRDLLVVKHLFGYRLRLCNSSPTTLYINIT